MKILTIIGARPQFIKASPVSRALRNKTGMQEIIVHTGQHFDDNMSQIFFDELDIRKPAYNLDIHGLPHGAMTGRMIEAIESVLLKEKPDYVLVYGDTNSTLAGALSAKKQHFRLGHVEAGLRSFNMDMPEELNRIVTDRIADQLFCPTDTAVQNLEKEGFLHFDSTIVLSGDVMYDAALHYKETARAKSQILRKLLPGGGPFMLATFHREDNTTNAGKLTAICNALNLLHREIPVILPLHPRTKESIALFNITLNCIVSEPLGYLDMIQLLENCSIVVTDSGGLQKEAFFFEKNCVTLRDETEWTELVAFGYNILSGTEENRIISCCRDMLSKSNDFSRSLYGNGNASEIIAGTLSSLQ